MVVVVMAPGLLISLLLVIFASSCYDGRSDDWLIRLRGSKIEESPFIVEMPQRELVKTEWGEIRVLDSRSRLLQEHKVGLGIITMLPRALLLPHYIDASFVFLVQQGSARMGWIDQSGKLLRQDLSTGDVYAVPAGTLFYLLSTDEEKHLKIYGVYDMSEATMDSGAIQLFSIAGESSVFSGFDAKIVAAAFKVSEGGVAKFFSQQSKGAIVPTTVEDFAKLMSMPERWSWRKVVDFFFNSETHGKAPRARSIYKDWFKNRNGWFGSTRGKKLPLLRKSRLGVSSVNLNKGALLAPHWNTLALVIGVVTNGSGTIQIAYPNGTNALDRILDKETMFVVPRYFPNCVVASRNAPLEFLGFTVSDKYHKHGQHPQFLAGKNSVLSKVDGDTLALSFNMPEKLVRSILQAQEDEIILSWKESEL